MSRLAAIAVCGISLVLGAASGCGGGHGTTTTDRGVLNRKKLEAEVKVLGNQLLRLHSKLTHARPGPHVRGVTCVKSEGDKPAFNKAAFDCRLSYSSGHNETWVVLPSPDGWTLERVVPKLLHVVPRQQVV
jgi:hypothetical protein